MVLGSGVKKWVKKTGVFLIGPAIIFVIEISGGRVSDSIGVPLLLVTLGIAAFLGEELHIKIKLALAIAATIFAVTVWPTPYKYFTAQNGFLVKVNRFTGDTYSFYPNSGWVER